MQSTWFDRAIGSVSPHWALRRARARLALNHTERTAQRFRYDGAMAGRRTQGWVHDASDANIELMGSLIWLRDRSRDLVRNNPYAVKAIEELVGNAVGTGITPQANTGNETLDRIIDSEWPYFVEKCDTPQRLDFYGMQAIIVRTMAESGESIIRFRPRLPKDNLRIPLQLQLLEADFLDQSRTMGTLNGHVMQGVEFDLIGRRVAYWLFTYHPGGLLILNPRGAILSQPIPADQVLHCYRLLRPGQVRGVPWLAPVMMALRDLGDYQDAELVRKKIEACLAGIVIQPQDNEHLGAVSNDPNTGKLLEGFEPGMMAYLRPGEDIRFNEPKAAGGYREFKVTELQSIASGIGVPYEQLASDMSATTYTSYKAGQLSFRNTIEQFRWLTCLPQFSQPVRRRFIDTLVLLGKLPGNALKDQTINLYATDWTAPRWESVDPYKDARAELQKIRTGTDNLYSAIAAQGMEPRRQLEMIGKINKELDRLGIVLDSDPRYTTLKGQPAIGQAEQDPTIVGDQTPDQQPGPGTKKPPPPSKKQPQNSTTEADKDNGLERFTYDLPPKRGWDSPVRRYYS